MRADLAAVLEQVPTAIRKMLREQCGGDWDRVTVEPDGGFMVHNGPQPFTFRDPAARAEPKRAVALRNVPRLEPQTETLRCRAGHDFTRTKKRGVKPVWCDEHRGQKRTASPPPPPPRVEERPRAKTPPPPPRPKMRTVDLRALAAHMGVEQKAPESTVTVVPAPERRLPPEKVEVWHEGDARGPKVDWEVTDLEQSAIRFRERFKDGLPAGQGFFYLPDVVALYGLDTDMVASVLRNPHRVEVRPESFDKTKRYPVLGFTRGDATVILGLRDPVHPTVIAVYMTALLEHDVHRVGSTGGGGAKKETGLPSNATQLKKRLLAKGAYLDLDMRTHKATVKYAGQDLGQISLDPNQPRDDVRTAWQRTIRRMHAIDQRRPA